MSELRKRFNDMTLQEATGRNICAQLLQSQIYGQAVKCRNMSSEYLIKMDSKYSLRGIPLMVRKLGDYKLDGDGKSHSFLIEALKALHLLQTSDGILGRGRHDHSNGTYIPGLIRASHIINMFDGVQTIASLLFHPEIRPSRDLNNLFHTPRHSSVHQMEIRSACLDILHDIFLNVDWVAVDASKNDSLIEYLFIIMEDKTTFSCASAVLEILLGSNRKMVRLSKIANLHSLIVSLRDSNFSSFCRILSVVIADIDFSEDRNTLLAQDKEEKVRVVERSIADSNQSLLLSFPEFLLRMAKLAGKSLSMAPAPLQRSGRSLENMILNGTPTHVISFLDELSSLTSHEGVVDTDDILGGDNLTSAIPRSLRYIHEVMYKVEIFYVLTLFLNGKSKMEVQSRLGDLKLIPSLCDLFDRLGWNSSSENFPSHNHSEAEDCDCTPESALKIQFLRFIHSFCDHSESKHVLLSTREAEEMHKICDQHNLEKPSGLDRSKRFRCRGEKGLLTKILDVLKKTTPNNALRFWLSRAIEGFLRGKVSPADQYFLIDRNIIEHLLEHILNRETKSREILQSSFDLLGELMKFNECAFQRFNCYVTSDMQFEQFVSTMTSNVIDSNMFIRCIILSLERFSSISTFYSIKSCKLSDLVRKWEHKMYLMYKLITSISVDNLTQENVSCLNTTLIFLMFAHNHHQLGLYLQAFLSEEQAQCHPGLILTNLRDLLEFWRVHYLQRAKDRTQLEQSSCIGFERWQLLVDTLLSTDNSKNTSILHYLSPRQQQAPSRIPVELMLRDA